MDEKIKSAMFGRIFTLFICALVLCLIAGGIITNAIGGGMKSSPKPALEVSLIISNIVIFFLPVILTLKLAKLKTANYLRMNNGPGWMTVAFVVLVFIISLPAMNCIVDWNQHVTLPASMKTIETAMRQMENEATQMSNMMINSSNMWELIIMVLIAGVLTGLCEETFFRGMLQKLLMDKPMNAHIAIWLAAIVFSALHMQFFGFVPRMLMGAYFGYIVWWTHSLWSSVIAHALNNSVVVIQQYLFSQHVLKTSLDELGVAHGTFPTLAVVSALLTAALMIVLYKKYFKKRRITQS
jgi:membrane protease YdiL (CAAX protease family)